MSAAERAAPVRGAPCWVNLMARDLRAAQDFYGRVLGWSFEPASPGKAFSLAQADGRPVAGLGALAPTLQVAVAWTPYFAVESVDDTAGRIRERGATVAVGPLELGAGRAALAADPDGAVFGFWDGGVPSWPVGEGRAPACVELRTRDAFAAALFYGAVFDWADDRAGGCDVTYEHDQVVIHDGTYTVAALRGGAVEAAPDPRVRPRWHVHFRVPDVRRAMEAAVAAGGTATPEPAAADDVVRQAVIRDPDGGLFTVSSSD